MLPLRQRTRVRLTASVPSGGSVSKSSSEAWAACTACMLQLMVPVSACWAELSVTRGGMCPRCICPLVMCCLACGMEPIWKLSGPPAPERMMAGSATEPVSTRPTLLNCCCSTVDLQRCRDEGRRKGSDTS
ncbi:hypothetical protein EYF80_036703 [Liparis tanakae]|uniref:Uncharacterized protein n=1 Tax=Liparis tanakae TaxID=230148 RepID=A0A4Z2GIV3_9TELE|nr:hypothetical protein EYF80_036703 [Liparis tanakae]